MKIARDAALNRETIAFGEGLKHRYENKCDRPCRRAIKYNYYHETSNVTGNTNFSSFCRSDDV